METSNWIKELVHSEQQMEESGIIDVSTNLDPEVILTQESIQFLLKIKTELVDAINVFNELKPSPLGRVKIYGIAKTHADFMLFRNGFKMIFSLKAPGVISVALNFVGANYVTSITENANQNIEEQLIEAKWGPFYEVVWTFNGQAFKLENMIRYYLSLFIKDSAK